MLTTRETEVFGPTSDPAAEVMTPMLGASGKELDPVFFWNLVALTLECSRQERMRLKHLHSGGVRLYLLVLN